MAEFKPTIPFPEVPVTLMNGKTVEIRPWSLKKGRLIRRKMTSIIDALQAAGKNSTSLTEIFDTCEEQVIEIVRDTIGVDDEWMEANVSYEDLFTLAQGVIETCLMRGGKDGIVGKLLGALGKQSVVELQPGLAARLEVARALGREPETTTETTAL